jgi:aminoglycoside phosphotransferase (APT) family kinase protein
MHKNQLSISETLVRQILDQQFPAWASLPMSRVASSGTVNAIFRLGNELAVRLPLLHEYDADARREWKWLTRLAGHLPLDIPSPVAIGTPSQAYPCHWLVVRWINGVNAAPASVRSPERAAEALGNFVVTLRQADIVGEDLPHYRGEALHLRDELTRRAIDQVSNEFDRRSLLKSWDRSLSTPDWTCKPCLFHGDLHPGNVLSEHGELSAVIDFGSLGTGDPSVDALPAWWMFSGRARAIFREAGEFQSCMWERARGWALSIALIALPYYRESNRAFADMARLAIQEVLADS